MLAVYRWLGIALLRAKELALTIFKNALLRKYFHCLIAYDDASGLTQLAKLYCGYCGDTYYNVAKQVGP